MAVLERSVLCYRKSSKTELAGPWDASLAHLQMYRSLTKICQDYVAFLWKFIAQLLPLGSPLYSVNGLQGAPLGPLHNRSYWKTRTLAPKTLWICGLQITQRTKDGSSGWLFIMAKKTRRGDTSPMQDELPVLIVSIFVQRVENRRWHGIWVEQGDSDPFHLIPNRSINFGWNWK